jgi:anti-anti-sigma regulatory factor
VKKRVKKITSRAVKRVSSTGRPPLPTQTLGENVLQPAAQQAPETMDPMKSAMNATAPAAADIPVTGRVVLGASCTIHEAQALRAHLLAQAAHPGPFEIDGGQVQQVDTAGVQLVVAFALDCLERGVPYSWKARSAAFDEAVRVLGVAALLESPG